MIFLDERELKPLDLKNFLIVGTLTPKSISFLFHPQHKKRTGFICVNFSVEWKQKVIEALSLTPDNPERFYIFYLHGNYYIVFEKRSYALYSFDPTLILYVLLRNLRQAQGRKKLIRLIVVESLYDLKRRMEDTISFSYGIADPFKVLGVDVMAFKEGTFPFNFPILKQAWEEIESNKSSYVVLNAKFERAWKEWVKINTRKKESPEFKKILKSKLNNILDKKYYYKKGGK